MLQYLCSVTKFSWNIFSRWLELFKYLTLFFVLVVAWSGLSHAVSSARSSLAIWIRVHTDLLLCLYSIVTGRRARSPFCIVWDLPFSIRSTWKQRGHWYLKEMDPRPRVPRFCSLNDHIRFCPKRRYPTHIKNICQNSLQHWVLHSLLSSVFVEHAAWLPPPCAGVQCSCLVWYWGSGSFLWIEDSENF